MQCGNGKGRAQGEGVEMIECFIHMRLEMVSEFWCEPVSINSFEGCQLASKMSLRGYAKREGTKASMEVQVGWNRCGSNGSRTPEPSSCLHIFSPQSIFHGPGLRFPWRLGGKGMGRTNLAMDDVSEDVLRTPQVPIVFLNFQCFKTSMFHAFFRS